MKLAKIMQIMILALLFILPQLSNADVTITNKGSTPLYVQCGTVADNDGGGSINPTYSLDLCGSVATYLSCNENGTPNVTATSSGDYYCNPVPIPGSP